MVSFDLKYSALERDFFGGKSRALEKKLFICSILKLFFKLITLSVDLQLAGGGKEKFIGACKL
jgi:hypothetical protein